MGVVPCGQDFVTESRIAFAVKLADQIATDNTNLSAFGCAEVAVRKIFGRWLLDHASAVPPPRLPLYLRLVDAVEQRLGVHRRRNRRPPQLDPAVACVPQNCQGDDERLAAA